MTATAAAGGSITPASASVEAGASADFTVTPDAGYSIDGVSGCGGTLSGNTYTTGAVTADCAVTAGFRINTYTVTANAGAGGSITPASATVEHGASADFTVTPDAGYSIDGVSGCGGTLSGNTYTTGAVTAACTVDATFATLPTVAVGDATVLEGDAGTVSLVFTVTLSAQANGDVNVDYAAGDGTATAGSDYTAAAGTLTIPAAATSADITVEVSGDAGFEPNETLTLTLSNVSANAQLGNAVATGTIANDDAGGLNDTGITACGDYAYGAGSDNHDNDLDCAAVGATASSDGADGDGDPVPAGQDARFGYDADGATNGDADGQAGFAFTKLDASGDPLADQSVDYATTPWPCVLDNVTGLIWEVKSDDGGLHDRDDRYNWYNTDAATNGGAAGYADDDGAVCSGYDAGDPATWCNTEAYVARVNAAGLCGAGDWRLPSQEELQSIAHLGRVSPAIDTGYFPNAQSSVYWSSSPDASASGGAWAVGFGNGDGYWYGKGSTYYVRLVRAGQ